MTITKQEYRDIYKERDIRLTSAKSKICDAQPTLHIEVDQHQHNVTKGKVLYENDEIAGKLKRTIVANTFFWMDSHDDVHVPGIFNKSIAENVNKNGRSLISHLQDHVFQIRGRVGRPIAFYEKEMIWRQLGHARNGSTVALIMESEIDRELDRSVYDEYKNDFIDQHSVQMRYITIDVAMNDSQFKTEYANWQEVYPRLGNKAKADAAGKFYIVREADLLEVSCVLMGSNRLTPVLTNPKANASDDIEKIDISKLLHTYKQTLNNN